MKDETLLQSTFKSFTFVMLLLHPRREGGGTQVYY